MEYVYLSVFCVVAVLVAYKAGYSKARGEVANFDAAIVEANRVIDSFCKSVYDIRDQSAALKGRVDAIEGGLRDNTIEIGNIYQALQTQDVDQQKESMQGIEEMTKLLKGMVGTVPDHVDAPLVPKTGHSLGSRIRKG